MSHTRHAIHAAIGAVSILAIGMVLGVALDRALLSPAAAAQVETPAQSLDERHRAFLRDLSADLGITEEQARQVHEILSRHQSAVNDAWEAVHARLGAAIDSVTSEIEAVLDSAQRAALHAWLLERHGATDVHGVGEGH